MTEGPLHRYRARVAAEKIEPDPAQEAAAIRLDALARELGRYRPGGGFLARFAGKNGDVPKGLYIHGAVGRGKSMLMDMFYDAVSFQPKRRVHFHAFMAEIHDRIAPLRKKNTGDPVLLVGEAMGRETKLLCFDELHVTDIADAMILSRLFTVLMDQGVVVVATSNAAPDELYRGGLNRALFLPFIALIKQNLEVLELFAAKDFRLEKLSGMPLYFTPADSEARANMDAAFLRLTGSQNGAPTELEVKGRGLLVPEAANGVARFTFADVCEAPLGPNDFLAIAHAFHTVLIEDIPVLSPAKRNTARRLINLIDTLYDGGVGLVVSAAAQPAELYPKGDGADLFERTASRLMEMRSEEYLQARGKRGRAAVAATG